MTMVDDQGAYAQIINWVALITMMPLVLAAAPYKFVIQVIPEYIESYTYAIPYWVSSYLFATIASYGSLFGLWIISAIQGAAGLPNA